MVRFRLPISDASARDILDIEGVVSIGETLVDGQPGISVGVVDQRTADTAPIPATIEGVPVVIEVEGDPQPIAAVPPLVPDDAAVPDLPRPVDVSRTQRLRPVPPGVSIAHRDVTAGTSAFVATDGSNVYQMSNNHVLGRNNQAQVGDPIVQPGPADGGTVENDSVGTLAGVVPVADEDNLVDLAWYEPDVEVNPDILDVGPPGSNVQDPELGDEVTMSGRTTGVRTGTVDKAHVTLRVGGSGRQFVDQFRLSFPLLGGDSGSPIITPGDGGEPMPAGIGFASTDIHGFCSYASNVQAESGLSVLPVGAVPPSEAGFGAAGWLVAGGLALAIWRARRSGV